MGSVCSLQKGEDMKQYTELVLREEDYTIAKGIVGEEFYGRCGAVTSIFLEAKYRYTKDIKVNRRAIIKGHKQIDKVAFIEGIPVSVARDIYIHALTPEKYKNKVYDSKWYMPSEVKLIFELSPRDTEALIEHTGPSKGSVKIGSSIFIKGSTVNEAIQTLKKDKVSDSEIRLMIGKLKTEISEELKIRGHKKPMGYYTHKKTTEEVTTLHEKMLRDLKAVKNSVFYNELKGYLELSTYSKQKVKLFSEAVADTMVRVGENRLFMCSDTKEIEGFIKRLGA